MRQIYLFAILLGLSFACASHAIEQQRQREDNSGGSSAISETQGRRRAERFNIIDWIRSNQATRAAQDAKYGRRGAGGKGGGPFPDFVLSYRTAPVTTNRDGVALGTFTTSTGRLQFLLDDLFSSGSRTRSLNSDLGFEVSYSQNRDFKADASSVQTDYDSKELSGALLIRPMGRSSQDSGLLLKFGYTNVDEKGWWANLSAPFNLFGPYLGADLKLYLMPFLGIQGEYQYVLEADSTQLTGKWKAQRFSYGAFLEIYLISIEAYLFNNEATLSPNGGVPVKETSTGTAIGASLYF